MIYECLPYYNEKLISKIRLANDINYVDQLVFAEANYTFKYNKKGYVFPRGLQTNSSVKYIKIDGMQTFVPNNRLGKIRLLSYRLAKDPYLRGLSIPSWYNEAQQRNAAANSIKPNDDDYVILCDVDEILDMKYLPNILKEVDKRGIVTCKLRFTMFYFDLFVEGWGGPKDYSYRMFIMTGKYFNHMKVSSDKLRKLGERNQLMDHVYCINEFCGFHHSWLGDADAVMKKMRAYAHALDEHTGSTKEYISECIKKGHAFFEGTTLHHDLSIKLLPEIENLRNVKPELFWKEE